MPPKKAAAKGSKNEDSGDKGIYIFYSKNIRSQVFLITITRCNLFINVKLFYFINIKVMNIKGHIRRRI